MIDTSWMIEGMKVPDGFKIDSVHPSYSSMVEVWQKCRDARAGAHSVKCGGDRYLPKLQSHKDTSNSYRDDDYKDYLTRSIWYGATGQTVSSFVGMIFRKNPAVSPSDEILMDTASSSGETFLNMMKMVCDELVTTNRVGLLEDFSGSTEGMSVLDAEMMSLKSYTAIYPAESIINWGFADDSGVKNLSFVVLKESYVDTNGLENAIKIRYRLLVLDENGNYKQIVIKPRKGESGDERYIESIEIPTKNGQTFDYIPFWCMNVYGDNIDDIRVPIINDLVEVNMGHYRNSADYENEMHYVSVKTAVFPAWNSELMGSPRIGGAIACPADQKPFILEATGTSYLADEMVKKEQRMASLGSQMLAQGGRYVQSAETSNNNSQGEESILQQIATSLDDVFSQIATLKMEWKGTPTEVTIATNKDYYADNIPNDKLIALVQSYQSGAISFDTFFYNMNKLEMYPQGWTIDDERGLIESSLTPPVEETAETQPDAEDDTEDGEM